MMELKTKISGGMLADFTAALRDEKPANFDGDVMRLPDAELARAAVRAARQAGWYEPGQAPTNEQLHAADFAELAAWGEAVFALFVRWNKRAAVTDEEKKVSSGMSRTS